MTKKITPIRSAQLFASMRRDGPGLADAEKRLGGKLIVARNLIRLRVQRGMTQAALASAAGISQPRIAEIESARANPRLDTLEKIAAVMGVSLESLVKAKHADRSKKVAVERSVHLSPSDAPEGWDDAESLRDVVEVTSYFPVTGQMTSIYRHG